MIGREGLHRQVLLDIVAEAGGASPRSYISTGNVTFACPPSRVGAVTRRVERGIEGVIGRREGLYVRSIAYLEELVASAPFAEAPFADPYERTVSFLVAEVDLPPLPVVSKRGDVSIFATTGTEVFAVNRMIDGRTSGAGGLIETSIGESVTTRSWNTVLRVVANPDPV